ncbi:efflux RND transporter periplasmic adaptor subunit [Magnetococcus sp. PR-3]|uniref:efflux RND transporter periplasmic adaptor subunit n=1 Tax=Magnetococcus sp. PR-3 TaxID=3120355 RepID=UPI002FCDFEF6
MKRSLFLALIMAVAMTVWLAGGAHVRARETPPPTARVMEPALVLPHVKVERIPMEKITREVVLRGQAQPNRVATLKSETTGKVVRLPGARGARLSKGSPLVQLSGDDRAARRVLAQANVAQAEAASHAAKSLNKKGFQADLKVKQANADLQAARAELESINLDIRRSTLYAPFNGIVRERFVELGEYVTPGDEMVELLDDHTIKIVADLPQQKVGNLTLGMEGQAIWMDGQKRTGKISYISPRADEQTRTFKVELSIDNPQSTLPLGASVEIHIPLAQALAHHLSPALLNLDSKGQLGVKVVGADSVVVWHSVKVIRAGLTGIWVMGVPEGAQIITLGGGFVEVGQEVTTDKSS